MTTAKNDTNMMNNLKMITYSQTIDDFKAISSD